MIEWTDELIAQIGSYSRAALSYLSLDGYPVTLPLPFTFDGGNTALRSRGPRSHRPSQRWRKGPIH